MVIPRAWIREKVVLWLKGTRLQGKGSATVPGDCADALAKIMPRRGVKETRQRRKQERTQSERKREN